LKPIDRFQRLPLSSAYVNFSRSRIIGQPDQCRNCAEVFQGLFRKSVFLCKVCSRVRLNVCCCISGACKYKNRNPNDSDVDLLLNWILTANSILQILRL